MNKRVVITGFGAITPIGCNVGDMWDNIKNGKHGIAPITRFDTEGYSVLLAAEVKDFKPEDYILKKETKRMDLFSRYAIAAAEQAVNDADCREAIKDNYRAGVILGSGIGGLYTIQEQVMKMNEKGASRINPLFIPMAIVNMAAGNISLKYGTKGINTAAVTACATGTNCIGDAFRSIKHGYSDIILAGGAEATINEIGVGGFMTLTALSEATDPDRASIPFDKDRNGFIMGEGAGVLVIEELEHALARGARIYCEIVGYGSTADAYHMTAPDAEGIGASAAIKFAMEEAALAPEDISYINAHGTSTQANDLPETMAIKLALGEHAYKIPVSSTKSMTGHLLGAAGAVEGIISALAIYEGFVPPTVGLETPGEGCDLDYVPKKGYAKELNAVLSNSFGFGGHNAVICFKKYHA